ncbi:metal-dependent hydrolase [Halocola ammonii]
MKLTYFGHSCFLLETNDKKILIDPFISPNELAKNIDVNDISCDYLLLSHGHEDHVADVDTVLTNNKNCQVVSNFEIIGWIQGKGHDNVHPMNHGGKAKFDFGSVKYVNAVHSSVLPDGTYGGNPGGFLFEIEGKTIYYAGDTALTMDMQLIGKYHKPDLAILPIGDNFTMGIEDAVICCDFIQCNDVIGMHYDTFPPVKIDHEEAKTKFNKAGKNLELMEIGSSKAI